MNRAAAQYQENYGEIFAILAREAGKSVNDAIAELREGVDFLRYYAAMARDDGAPLGVIACISPWNFPLAIFTGQIAAALVTGNAVIAKPAPQTPLIAHYLVDLLHRAGVPKTALQLVLGGGDIGERLVSNRGIDGVVFTGSTATARRIQTCIAQHLAPSVPLLAETGGINAMIIDSTALLEQATAAVLESAFASAGQRCSALRCLYVQQDIADDFLTMLIGAMRELTLGDPWRLDTDIGPVIDSDARARIDAYIEGQAENIIHQCPRPANGNSSRRH